MQKFNATLPAVRCTEDMREAIAELADVNAVDLADIIRDAIEVYLRAISQAPAVEPTEPPRKDTPEDRTRGLAWGPPAE